MELGTKVRYTGRSSYLGKYWNVIGQVREFATHSVTVEYPDGQLLYFHPFELEVIL